MNQILELIKNKNDERRQALREIENKAKYANHVLDEVYEKRLKQLKFKQELIENFFADGDFEGVKEKMAEIEELMRKPADEEIKTRLADYNMKKCNYLS